MKTPDLTPTAKMAHTICRAANGACRCEARKYVQHCDAMELAGREAMAAAGMAEADVQALLDGVPAKKAPSNRRKKGGAK